MRELYVKRPIKIKYIGLIALLIALGGCGGGGGSNAAQPLNNGADVNEYLREVSNWQEYSPPVESQNGPTADPQGNPEDYAEADPENANCKITQMSMQQTPDDIVLYNPNGQVMWLGNLITGNSYKNLGSFEQLDVSSDERAPLTITIDFLRGNNYIQIPEPRFSTVQSAIGELVDEAEQAGLVTSSDARWNVVSAQIKEQVALELGFSAKYLGSSASADLEIKKTGTTNTVVAHFVQKLYTVYVDPETDGQGFFSSEFTEDSLQRLIDAGQIGPNNPPVYISSIGYGRILTYKLTGQFSESELRAAVNFSYNSGVASGEVKAKGEEVMSHSETRIEVVALGGSETAVLNMISSGNLNDYFISGTPLTAVRPISYQMSSVKEPTVLASVANVMEYQLKTCEVSPAPAVATGETVSVTLHKVHIKFDCDPGADAGDIWGWFQINGKNVFNIDEKNDKQIGSGNSLALGQGATSSFSFKYGDNRMIRIRGELIDNDGFLNGGDDIAGTWDFYVNLENTNKTGVIKYKNGSNACGSDRPVLHWSVRRTGFLYD